MTVDAGPDDPSFKQTIVWLNSCCLQQQHLPALIGLKIYTFRKLRKVKMAQRIQKEQQNINILPDEMLCPVFSMLNGGNKKTVFQVCRRWRSVCEQLSLWTWVTITVKVNQVQRLGSSQVDASDAFIVLTENNYYYLTWIQY